MSSFRKIIALVTVGFCTTFSSHAALINLTSYASQPSGSGQGTLEQWVADLVAAYNTANNPDLPTSSITEAFRVNGGGTPPSGFPAFGSNVVTLSLPVGAYNYLVLHWGGPDGGATPSYQGFYIGDISGSVSFSNLPDQQGLSSYSYYSPTRNRDIGGVPDGGLTLVLLGMSIAGIGFFRKYIAR